MYSIVNRCSGHSNGQGAANTIADVRSHDARKEVIPSVDIQHHDRILEGQRPSNFERNEWLVVRTQQVIQRCLVDGHDETPSMLRLAFLHGE